MGKDHVRAGRHCLIQHWFCKIQCKEYMGDFFLIISHQKSYIVPFLRKFLRMADIQPVNQFICFHIVSELYESAPFPPLLLPDGFLRKQTLPRKDRPVSSYGWIPP